MFSNRIRPLVSILMLCHLGIFSPLSFAQEVKRTFPQSASSAESARKKELKKWFEEYGMRLAFQHKFKGSAQDQFSHHPMFEHLIGVKAILQSAIAFEGFLQMEDFYRKQKDYEVLVELSIIAKEKFGKGLKKLRIEQQKLRALIKDSPLAGIFKKYQLQMQDYIAAEYFAIQGNNEEYNKIVNKWQERPSLDHQFLSTLYQIKEKARKIREEIAKTEKLDINKYLLGIYSPTENEAAAAYVEKIDKNHPKLKGALAKRLLREIGEAAYLNTRIPKFKQIYHKRINQIRNGNGKKRDLQRILFLLERRERRLSESSHNPFKKRDFHKEVYGATNGVLPISLPFMQILAFTGITILEIGSVALLGPKGVAVALGITAILTAAYAIDFYNEYGRLPTAAHLGKTFINTSLVMIPVAALFQVMVVLGPVTASVAFTGGTLFGVYGTYQHYLKGEYWQMGVTLLLTAFVAYQGTKLALKRPAGLKKLWRMGKWNRIRYLVKSNWQLQLKKVGPRSLTLPDENSGWDTAKWGDHPLSNEGKFTVPDLENIDLSMGSSTFESPTIRPSTFGEGARVVDLLFRTQGRPSSPTARPLQNIESALAVLESPQAPIPQGNPLISPIPRPGQPPKPLIIPTPANPFPEYEHDVDPKNIFKLPHNIPPIFVQSAHIDEHEQETKGRPSFFVLGQEEDSESNSDGSEETTESEQEEDTGEDSKKEGKKSDRDKLLKMKRALRGKKTDPKIPRAQVAKELFQLFKSESEDVRVAAKKLFHDKFDQLEKAVRTWDEKDQLSLGQQIAAWVWREINGDLQDKGLPPHMFIKRYSELKFVINHPFHLFFNQVIEPYLTGSNVSSHATHPDTFKDYLQSILMGLLYERLKIECFFMDWSATLSLYAPIHAQFVALIDTLPRINDPATRDSIWHAVLEYMDLIDDEILEDEAARALSESEGFETKLLAATILAFRDYSRIIDLTAEQGQWRTIDDETLYILILAMRATTIIPPTQNPPEGAEELTRMFLDFNTEIQLKARALIGSMRSGHIADVKAAALISYLSLKIESAKLNGVFDAREKRALVPWVAIALSTAEYNETELDNFLEYVSPHLLEMLLPLLKEISDFSILDEETEEIDEVRSFEKTVLLNAIAFIRSLLIDYGQAKSNGLNPAAQKEYLLVNVASGAVKYPHRKVATYMQARAVHWLAKHGHSPLARQTVRKLLGTAPPVVRQAALAALFKKYDRDELSIDDFEKLLIDRILKETDPENRALLLWICRQIGSYTSDYFDERLEAHIKEHGRAWGENARVAFQLLKILRDDWRVDFGFNNQLKTKSQDVSAVDEKVNIKISIKLFGAEDFMKNPALGLRSDDPDIFIAALKIYFDRTKIAIWKIYHLPGEPVGNDHQDLAVLAFCRSLEKLTRNNRNLDIAFWDVLLRSYLLRDEDIPSLELLIPFLKQKENLKELINYPYFEFWIKILLDDFQNLRPQWKKLEDHTKNELKEILKKMKKMTKLKLQGNWIDIILKEIDKSLTNNADD